VNQIKLISKELEKDALTANFIKLQKFFSKELEIIKSLLKFM